MGNLTWLPALIVPYFTQQKKKKVTVFMRLTKYGGWKGWSDRPERTPTSPALGGIQKTVRWRRGLLHRLKAPLGGRPSVTSTGVYRGTQTCPQAGQPTLLSPNQTQRRNPNLQDFCGAGLPVTPALKSCRNLSVNTSNGS